MCLSVTVFGTLPSPSSDTEEDEGGRPIPALVTGLVRVVVAPVPPIGFFWRAVGVGGSGSSFLMMGMEGSWSTGRGLGVGTVMVLGLRGIGRRRVVGREVGTEVPTVVLLFLV